MVSDGTVMFGTWFAATFGSGSFNPWLGVVIGIETSPALFGGIWEMYHGLHTMYEAVESPSYNFEEKDKNTPCP